MLPDTTATRNESFIVRDGELLNWTDAGGNLVVEGECPGPGGLNGDDVVDGADLGLLLGHWGQVLAGAPDMNGDQ